MFIYLLLIKVIFTVILLHVIRYYPTLLLSACGSWQVDNLLLLLLLLSQSYIVVADVVVKINIQGGPIKTAHFWDTIFLLPLQI